MDPSAAAIASRRIVFPPRGPVLVLMISAIIGSPIRPYPDGLGGLFARCSLWVRSGHAATAGSVSIGPPMVPITDGHRERSSKEESHGNQEDARSTTV